MATLYPPPPGYIDMLADAQPNDGFTAVDVDGIGEVLCKRPNANAVAVLGAAVDAKISEMERAGYQNLFIQNHTGPGEFERLLAGMMMGDYPSDTMQEVVRAIITLDTARPTRRSSR